MKTLLDEIFEKGTATTQYAITGQDGSNAVPLYSLADTVEEIIKSGKVADRSGLNCVKFTYRVFVEVMRAQGISNNKSSVCSTMEDPCYHIPQIQNKGPLFPHEKRLAFILTWYSNNGHDQWKNIAERGYGAPGALFAAGLAEAPYAVSREELIRLCQDKTLPAGTFLQVWKSNSDFQQVRETSKSIDGHSCILRGCQGQKIFIADQYGDNKLLNARWQYIIAARPKQLYRVPILPGEMRQTPRGLSLDQLKKAVRYNVAYGSKIGWQPYISKIVKFLGINERLASSDAALARRVYQWQRTNLGPHTADGKLGPATWRKMSAKLGIKKAALVR